jgi:anti-sigma-K factor RskA
MRRDRQFAAIVSRWETNLSAFNDDYDVVSPGQETFKQIEARLFGEPEAVSVPSRGLWSSIVFWRCLALVSLLITAGALTIATVAVTPPQTPAPLVAELTAANSQVNLLASYERQSGRLRIVPVAIGKPQEKSLELWLVPATGTPRSLGVFPSDQTGELVIPVDMRGNIGEGASLAVSLEPFGGSPTGQATGPIVASGTTHRR